MDTSVRPKERLTSHWFLFIFLLVSSISFYLYFTADLYYYSTNVFIPNLQKFFLSILTKEKLQQIANIFSFFGSEKIYIIIIIIFYNFLNIYKTYLLFCSLSISQLILSFFKIFFIAPRPYWSNKKKEIFPYDCQGGFAAPSSHTYTATVFYLVLWHIIYDRRSKKINQSQKRKLLMFFLFIIFIIGFSRILSGAHSIDQVIFGFLLGLCFYIFIFHVFHINCNSNNQILSHINISLKKMCLIVLMILLSYLGLLSYRIHDKDLNQIMNVYSKQIKEICPSLPISKTLYNDSLLFFVAIFSNFSAFIALKFEFFISFENNYSNWSQYNFEIDENEKLQMSRLTSNISITKPIQWNHTSVCKSIFRLIFTFIMVMLSGIFYFLIKWDNPKIYLVIFVKVCLSESLISFGMFFTFKVFLKWLKLSNMTLFFMLRESI